MSPEETICPSNLLFPAPSDSDVSNPVQSPSPVRRSSVPRSLEEIISCQRCRQRKKRCDRVKPSCGSCLRGGASCVYLSPPSERHSRQYLWTEIARLQMRCKDLEGQLESSLRSNSSIHLPTSVPYMDRPLPVSTYDLHAASSSSSVIRSTRPTSPSLSQRVLIRLLTRESDPTSSFSGIIGSQLGTATNQHEDRADKPHSSTVWPPKPVAQLLMEHYFALSHAIVPMVDRNTIEDDFRAFYPDDPAASPDPTSTSTPDLRIYRLSMVFVSGSGMAYRERALQYDLDLFALHALALKQLPAVLQADEITCVSGICQLAFLSIVEFLSMNPYQVISIAAVTAMEIGLHVDDPTLPPEDQDRRRRIFWSLYCMDRLVSTLLVKPLSIPDNIISTRLPSSIEGGALLQFNFMSSTSFFRQLVLLRRMQGIMLERVNLASDIVNPEMILAQLRNQIDQWWAQSTDPNSMEREPFLELGYNTFLVNLYRPSRLFAQTQSSRMPVLRGSACRALTLYRQFCDQNRIAQNYVHFHSIVISAVALLYVLGESEGDTSNLEIVSWRTAALADVDSSEALLAKFCTGWPGVDRFRAAFGILANNVRRRLVKPAQSSPLPAWASPTDEMNVRDELVPLAGATAPNTDETADDWATWIAGLADLPTYGARESVGGDEIDAFLSSVGLADWIENVAS